MWDTVPEERRVATDVLFKAAEEVYAIHNIEWESSQERSLSKALFLIGGTSGAGDLLDKFRAVMEKNGVEIEFSEGGFQSDYEDDTVPHKGGLGQDWADGEEEREGMAEADEDEEARYQRDEHYERGNEADNDDTTNNYIFRENRYWPALSDAERYVLNERRLAQRAYPASQRIPLAELEPVTRHVPRESPIVNLEDWDMGANESSLPSELALRRPKPRQDWGSPAPIPPQPYEDLASIHSSRPQTHTTMAMPSSERRSSPSHSNARLSGIYLDGTGLGINGDLRHGLSMFPGPQPDVPPSVETDVSPPTIESLEQHPVASDTTVQLDDGAYGTSFLKSTITEPQLLFSHYPPPLRCPLFRKVSIVTSGVNISNH